MGSISAASPTTISIAEEVAQAQALLRSRLAGALTSPPESTPARLLPTVPLIDLSPSFADPSTNAPSTLESRQQVASQIRAACVSTGFFQISNHGIPTSVSEGIITQASRFFHDLPQSKKDQLHIRHSRLFRGYEPGGATYVNPDDSTNAKGAGGGAETKEGFNWGYEPSLDPTGGDGKYVELDGSTPSFNPENGDGNVWPSESDLPGFKQGVADYYAHVLSLARHLFRLFALSLGLKEDYFDDMTTHPGGIGRLLYYPAQPPLQSNSDTNIMNEKSKLGLGAHTDYECFTLLLSSPSPGLEILFPPSAATDNKPLWLPCPVRPGTLTVNVADFLQRWTRGVYKSTIHRVITKPGWDERYSVPFFFSVNYDAEVQALHVEGSEAEGVGSKEYGSIKAGEYVLERLRVTKVE